MQRFRTECGRNSFSHQAIIIWNHLSTEIKTPTSLSQFNQLVKGRLLLFRDSGFQEINRTLCKSCWLTYLNFLKLKFVYCFSKLILRRPWLDVGSNVYCI